MGRFDPPANHNYFSFSEHILRPLNMAIRATARIASKRGKLRSDDPIVKELVPNRYKGAENDFFQLVGKLTYSERSDSLSIVSVPPVQYGFDKENNVATLKKAGYSVAPTARYAPEKADGVPVLKPAKNSV